jgi:hypothetical protein
VVEKKKVLKNNEPVKADIKKTQNEKPDQK